MSYASVLDNASKAAAAVGLILGLSYAAGLFKNLGLCSSLSAGWLFELMDVQMFINSGLPSVMLSIAVVALTLGGLKGIDHLGSERRYIVRGVGGSLCLSWILVPYLGLTEGENMLRSLSAAILVGGAAIMGWCTHRFIAAGVSNFVLASFTVGTIMVLSIAPMIDGYVQADDIKFARPATTEVIDGNNKVVGILVRVMAGKYLVMDCSVKYQMSMFDISPALRLRVSSGRCKAIF